MVLLGKGNILASFGVKILTKLLLNFITVHLIFPFIHSIIPEISLLKRNRQWIKRVICPTILNWYIVLCITVQYNNRYNTFSWHGVPELESKRTLSVHCYKWIKTRINDSRFVPHNYCLIVYP